ncbi:hypothetical protein SAMN05216338_1009104 [Bradyrhizobium sp. Rc2d]|uniref:hypothetical protein n=1 Tax=Bradyrhizobium sp. Rc2d TaxID=1855321 RepID=UPI00087FD129|nr:hypothetical protein [Bradyrhizobium sp. Rc2d]SDH44493.1 hypothetical protein SAMN05216338_1009104 [Bradyrhizobium sp. Rc2d]
MMPSKGLAIWQSTFNVVRKRESAATKGAVARPRPPAKDAKAEVERRLSLVDPDSLVSASYGYFEQSTPRIVSNDGALAGVSKLADNSIDCVVS